MSRRFGLSARRILARASAWHLARGLKELGRENAAHVLTLDASTGHPRAEATLPRVREAIGKLHDRSAIHVRWMKRCVNQLVLVAPMPAPAAFDRFTRSVFLSCDVGDQYDPTAIASILAHEVAHARMAALGVRYSPRQVDTHRRVERRCVREQLEALLRIDPEHFFVPWSRELLRPELEPQLTPSAEQSSAVRLRTFRRFRSKGVPRWIGRLANRIARDCGRVG